MIVCVSMSLSVLLSLSSLPICSLSLSLSLLSLPFLSSSNKKNYHVLNFFVKSYSNTTFTIHEHLMYICFINFALIGRLQQCTLPLVTIVLPLIQTKHICTSLYTTVITLFINFGYLPDLFQMSGPSTSSSARLFR